MNELLRYAGSVLPGRAIYRPHIIGMAGVLPADIGIASYAMVDLDTLRSIDGLVDYEDQLSARATEIDSEAAGLPFKDEQRAEFDAIIKARAEIAERVKELRARKAYIDAMAAAGKVETEAQASAFSVPNVRTAKRVPDNLHDLKAYRQLADSLDEVPSAYRDGAMKAIEKADFPTAKDPDKARADVERLLAKHRDEDHGVVARRILSTTSPEYQEAIAAYMAGGREAMSPRLQAVLQTGSNSDGGFAIPVTIDPTFIITTDGAASPLREFARVETITTKSWHPITTEDGAASYGTEVAATTDTAPNDLDDVNGVVPLRAKRFIKFTAEFQEDYGAAAILAQAGVLVRDSKDLLEAEKFVQGTGGTEPEGIIWKLDDDATSLVTSATFDLDALDSVTAALGPRFRNGNPPPAYMANLSILQKVRQLGTAGAPANSIYDQISGLLNGRPARELSFMDDIWSASPSKTEVLLFGQFKQFVIVDRIGLAVEYVPQVFDGSGDPLGQRGIYARWRNTSKVITVNAFRLLSHS